ncbi:MAG: hypothetical protein CJBNEKGG_03976 [Prosthecobacter sp.]|nr:hypothetical protein [Prosthecobacter sp.]
MSFSDPGFLFSSRPTDNERLAARLEAERRVEAACAGYRRATWVVVLTMIYLALPTGLDAWHWHVVAGAGVLVLTFGIVMALNGAVKNALISLLFAAVILPGWVLMAPKVISTAREQSLIILREWQRVF